MLEMVRGVSALDLEVCCTLGMLTEEQADQLKEAGLTAYNHNLDTSPEFYGNIITTRVYDDRLQTLSHVRKAGITVCCGGILGMGETEEDRIGLLQQLASLDPHPESVPINMLVRAEGTPLEHAAEIDSLVMVRAIATARILMPASRVRLAAGRQQMSPEAVTLCFLAGANSIFTRRKTAHHSESALRTQTSACLQNLGMKAHAACLKPAKAKFCSRMSEELEALPRAVAISRARNSAAASTFASNDYLGLATRSANSSKQSSTPWPHRRFDGLDRLAAAFRKCARVGGIGIGIRALCGNRGGALFRLGLRGQCRIAQLDSEARRHCFLR